MDAIYMNPYRIIGLYANASQKDIQRNCSKINAFLTAGKPIPFKVDFPFLPEIHREVGMIDSALAGIQLNQERLLHSLFWFSNGSHIDEPAFLALEENHTEKAADIWDKVSTSRESLRKYNSALNNLGTLKMIRSMQSTKIDPDELSDAMRLKQKLIDSEFFDDYASSITNSTYKPDRAEIMRLFVEQLLEYLIPYSSKGRISLIATSRIFSNVHKDLQQHVIGKIGSPLVAGLNSKISKNQGIRKANPIKALDLGMSLYALCIEDLRLFRDLVGKNDMEYHVNADKLSEEILQCAIDHFNYYKGSGEYKFFDRCRTLLEKAQSLAVRSLVKQRIDENTKELVKWVEETPERLKFESIKNEALQIMASIESSTKSEASIPLAKSFLNDNTQALQKIQVKLGQNDEAYLNISSMVANVVLQIIIDVNNNHQSLIMYTASFNKNALIERYKYDLKEAWEVFPFIEALDKHAAVRDRVAENKSVLKSIMINLNINPDSLMNSFKKFLFG